MFHVKHKNGLPKPGSPLYHLLRCVATVIYHRTVLNLRRVLERDAQLIQSGQQPGAVHLRLHLNRGDLAQAAGMEFAALPGYAGERVGDSQPVPSTKIF